MHTHANPKHTHTQVIRQLRCEGYVRSVAWDPEGVYVAATLAEGSLCVFEASNGKLQARKRVVRKVGVIASCWSECDLCLIDQEIDPLAM